MKWIVSQASRPNLDKPTVFLGGADVALSGRPGADEVSMIGGELKAA